MVKQLKLEILPSPFLLLFSAHVINTHTQKKNKDGGGTALAGMAQWVGVSSCTQKGGGFDS